MTEVGNPAILFMIEDTTPTTNPHINAINTWHPTGYRIHVVSVTRNKDESDAQKKAQQSRDLIEKYRQGGEGGLPMTRTTPSHHNQGPCEKAPVKSVEGSNPNSKMVNISLARVSSTRGSGAIKKIWHPVKVKVETAGREPRLYNPTPTPAQRVEKVGSASAGPHPRPGPMPATTLE